MVTSSYLMVKPLQSIWHTVNMNNMTFKCIMSHIIKNASFELDNLGKGGYDILTYGETGACVKEVWEWLAYRIIHYGLINSMVL